MSAVIISSAFDSGNIEVLDASDPADVRLAVRTDATSADPAASM